MSQKQTKQGSPGTRPTRGVGGKKSETGKDKTETDGSHNENVVNKLYKCFQDIFDYDLVASVCHTCQWDAAKATEALMVLGDAAHVSRNRNSKWNKGDINKNKPKSLPSTLKPNKSESETGNYLYAMPNSLKSNPAHVSTSSLSSGQVWQRHYKSKPQSPGLLTMIPPYSKEASKLKKSGSARSLPSQVTPTKAKENPEVKKASATVKRIQHLVQNGIKVLILMRGVPGSGKTHLAQIVVNLVISGSDLSQHIFSTDDYFIMLGRGNYAYDSHQLPLAHHWNQRRVFEALRRATNPVVVDNTHTQAWEMEPYVSMAVSQGYLIEVLEPVTPWRAKEAELAKRNIHSVPREKIRQMLERYERGWTGEKLIQLFGLNYAPCGSSHVSQELTTYNNSPLAQHRQHGVIDTPEKPKRKKSSPKRKDRRHLVGIEITEDKEKQLEELNQLFAEYGKKMDPLSKKKVLESGVPISEVVSRMRKLQGSILPLPKMKLYPASIPEKDIAQTDPGGNMGGFAPNYPVFPGESPCESVEPDTMSSSNASETSECESDTEAEGPKPGGKESPSNYGHASQFVEGNMPAHREGIMGEYANEIDLRMKNKKGIGGGCKAHSGITSSQEELSIIDFELSTNPACSSQEELSLLDFDDGDENRNEKDGSSSSSEEQETQLLTLQESLREVLIDSYEKRKQLEEQSGTVSVDAFQGKDLIKKPETISTDDQIRSSDSLMNAVSKLEKVHISEECLEGDSSLDRALVDYLLKSYDIDKSAESKGLGVETSTLRKRSPDLEEVPLPSIPPESEMEKRQTAGMQCTAEKDPIDEILSSWESCMGKEKKPDDTQSKPQRSTKSGLSGAMKKTGIQRDQSPEELLRSVELSWSSIPFTFSWEDVNRKAGREQKELERPAQRPKPQRKPVTKVDSSTNTRLSDFYLWKDEKNDLVKITPQNRNINESLTYADSIGCWNIEHPMLNKSSMTSDSEEYNAETMDSSLDMLSGMFPDIQVENLADILEKCKGDIHWAVELLLESPHNIQISAERKLSEESASASGTVEDGDDLRIDNLVISDGKKTIKRRKDRKSVPSELSLMLKKQIEDSIHINEECYQEKTLFLKQLRHGEIALDYNPVQKNSFGDSSEIPGFASEEQPQQQEDEEEDEETIPMKIDPEFFRKLALQFGHYVEPEKVEGPHSVSEINIPVSLGHQIYSCWLETVNRQVEEMQSAYDDMIKEDEVLAKALQEQEHDQHKPDLREIMDMELAMALYKQDEKQSQGINEETMASMLSKQRLFEAYPNIDRRQILDLFRSQGNSFQKTVDVLESQKGARPITVAAPELLKAYENNLIEKAKKESPKKDDDSPRKPIIVIKQPNRKIVPSSEYSKDVLVVNPAEFRQDMSLLQKRRNDCCRQAQEAFRNKSYSVASYYSHIASLYKERILEMSKKSISLKLFEDNNKRNEPCPRVLDLHFLFVSEALQIVDLFLDHHISELNRKSVGSVDLYLITGRGVRSRSKKPKVKPAILRRLEQRKIDFIIQNPGMLKITVQKGNFLSSDL